MYCKTCVWLDTYEDGIGKTHYTCRYGGEKRLRLIGQDVGCEAWQDSGAGITPPESTEQVPCIPPDGMMALHAMPVRLYRADGWTGYGIIECNRKADTFRAYNPDIGYLPYWTYRGFQELNGSRTESTPDEWWARQLIREERIP